MYEVPEPDVPEGTVVDVMQSGYAIGDRCLRPALVAVAKGGAKQPKPQGDGDASAARKAANDDFPDGGQAGRLTPLVRCAQLGLVTRRSVRLNLPPSARRSDVPLKMRSMP